MNAHINYDLPQAIVAVISDEQFDDAALIARREADHRAIDDVLAARVAAEDDELASLSGPAPLLDRVLAPLNRLGTQRFLREARQKVWANADRAEPGAQAGPGRLRRRPRPAGGAQRGQGHGAAGTGAGGAQAGRHRVRRQAARRAVTGPPR